ncbi:hypothetical protein GS474_05010 [Rhodococcus hoagii]|nr:hypothetical protein [Prescottella equi]
MTATTDHPAAAKLLVFDFAQRTADLEDAAAYRAHVERIVDGPDAGAVLRGVLELLAATDTVENRRAAVERCRALAFIDADVLEDQARGHRPGGNR